MFDMPYFSLKEKIENKQKAEINVPDDKNVDTSNYIKKLHVRDQDGKTWTVDGKEDDKFILSAVLQKKVGVPSPVEKKLVSNEELKKYELA